MTRTDAPSYVAPLQDRLPPHSIPAEMCAIASLLLCGDDSKLFTQIRALLHRDAFFQTDHQIIYDVITDLADKAVPLDSVIVREELVRRQLFEEIGGNTYLHQILNAVPNHRTGPHYANIVREKFIGRQTIAKCEDTIRSVHTPEDADCASALAMKAATELSEISAKGQVHEIESAEDLVGKWIDARDTGRVGIIPTGIKDLDKLIAGIRKGRFTIIGAKASMGKSTMLRQILLNRAQEGMKVGLVAIEEDDSKITANLLSNLGGIENHKLINHEKLSTYEEKQLVEAMAKLGSLPLRVVDTAFNLTDISATIHRLVLEEGCEVIGVDHLHLIDGEVTKGGNRNQEVSGISRHLKMLFRKLNVAGVVAAQLNRGGDGIQGHTRQPVLRDLRDSGTLEQDGDLILLLNREDVYRYAEPGYRTNGFLETLIAKNKDGAPAVITLDFWGGYQRVKDLPEDKKPRTPDVPDPFSSG